VTPFAYHRAAKINDAVRLLTDEAQAAILGGGTSLLDLMKQGVEKPRAVIDIASVPEMRQIATDADGALVVGAAVTMTEVAQSDAVLARWPLVAETTLAGLTPQLRNAATVGGNLMQRPRCIYFREGGFACNKLRPGSGCAAKDGVHFGHAIFGGAAAHDCMAVHPSDLSTGLLAMDASVEIAGRVAGQIRSRRMPLDALYRWPEADATRETTLAPHEMITAVIVPPAGEFFGAYVKGPPEGFALASCAALLKVAQNGVIFAARIAIGGVAHRPLRHVGVEKALTGQMTSAQVFEAAAAAAVVGAETDPQTAFRVPLLRAVVVEALQRAVERAKRAGGPE
jgi:xanthine dehydrogenase YagS FAD-binding subunit